MAKEKVLTSIDSAYHVFLANMINWNATYNGDPFNFDHVAKDTKIGGWWIPTLPHMTHIESQELVEVEMIDLEFEIQQLRNKYARYLKEMRG